MKDFTEVNKSECKLSLIARETLGTALKYEELDKPVSVSRPDFSLAVAGEEKEGEKVENTPIENKKEGCRRERDVGVDLEKKYPPEEGYMIESEVYLRDKEGNIVRDSVTGEARRIDFAVLKDGKVVDSIEVTSRTADKTAQSAKEARIRDRGGNYIKDSNGNLVEIPLGVQTRIERRD